MSKENKNPLMGEQKKKKHLWGLWIPLIIIGLIIVLPVTLVMALFFDPSHVDTGITETKDQGQVFNGVLTNMFDNCRTEEPSLDLVIKQKDLNQLLFNVQQKVAEQGSAGDYLKQFSVEIKDKSYVFDIEASALGFFKTHIKLEAEATTGAELDEGKKGFLFKISDLKVGRLGNLQSVLPWAANTLKLDLSNIFVNAGLSINFDMEKLTMTYPYDDFIADMVNMVGSSNTLFMDIFSNFFSQNLISFTHTAGNNVTGKINLADFMANPTYTNGSHSLPKLAGSDVPLLVYESTVAQSLVPNVIADDASTAANVFAMTKFLSFGQEYLSGNEKTYIVEKYPLIKDTLCDGNDIDTFSSNRKNEVFGSTDSDLLDKVTSLVNDEITTNLPTYTADVLAGNNVYIFGETADPLEITDEEVRTMLKANTGLIGYGFSFTGKDDSNNLKTAFTMLDKVYPTLIPATETAPDLMALNFGLNINGAETTLILPMEATTMSGGDNVFGMDFDIKNSSLLFGTKEFPNLKGQIQSIMNDVSLSGDVIEFVKDEAGNVSNLRMSFNFKKYFEDHSDSQFAKFNKTAEDHDYDLVVKFDIASCESDAPGNRAGQFNLTVGYEKKS
ncbi:MAG: hypothetical protein K5906_04315 [Bacilli bacterium]|nr:hypothetical protein [Bacilli bacterium]